MVTLLSEAGEFAVAGARAEGDACWVPEDEAAAITGWVRKPEGLCRDERCVPLPPGGTLLRDGRVDVAGFWRRLGQAVVRSEAGHVWVLGEGAAERSAALQGLQAPDFRLPDPAGRLHALSDYRGRKVLLVTWASW
jgi:hypothetical protein